MKGCSRMECLRGKELSVSPMAMSMKENSRMASTMAMVSSNGKMAILIGGSTVKASNMVSECWNSKTCSSRGNGVTV